MKSLARILCVVLTLVVALGSFAGYFGEENRYLEIIGGNRLQFFFLSLGIFPVLLILCLRKKRLVNSATLFIGIASVVVNAVEVLPWYLPSGEMETAIEGSSKIRLIAYNVLHQNSSYEATREYIIKEAPDFVVFFEATGRWPKELEKLSKSLPHRLRFPQMQMEVFGRYPLETVKERLFGEYRGYVVVEMDVDGKRISICPSHCYPQFHFGEWGFDLRNEQLLVGIGEEIGGLEDPRIVIGDLNVDIWSPVLRKAKSKSRLRDARKGFGVLPTQWAIGSLRLQRILGRPIDHCLVSPDVRVNEMKVGPPIGSDHLPLVVELEIP